MQQAVAKMQLRHATTAQRKIIVAHKLLDTKSS